MINQTPYLIVGREVHEGTDLWEVWTLKSCYWGEQSPYNGEGGPTVTVHVTNKDSSPTRGIPEGEHVASSRCDWGDVPAEIKQAFRDEAEQIHECVKQFG